MYGLHTTPRNKTASNAHISTDHILKYLVITFSFHARGQYLPPPVIKYGRQEKTCRLPDERHGRWAMTNRLKPEAKDSSALVRPAR